ncbi:ABC transporter permease subunit [Nocardioides sp.]|uniref:ABC transporter permease n=1 Tax=Nocardioides sp. TaxID=35761 RepID=UPI00286DEBAC|nr:ABC transporter permease subunit [Nocardioides sp.]
MSESTRRITQVARHEYRAALRSRVLVILIAILVASTIGSVLIGASDYAAQLADYNNYRAAASAQGLTRIAPSPLAVLSLLRGVLEYLEILGAIIAITLGYLSVSRERINRTLPLLRSRPLTGAELATGSYLGALGIFATLISATALVGVVSLGLIGHDWISPIQVLRVGLACLAALLYLSAFYCLGAIATAKAKVPVNGLTIALGIWLVVVLVLPQIGDTLDADNQLPGGLFQALGLNHDGELAVLTHFTGYERVRTGIEEASLAKHFERFAFAMTDVKERYRPYGLLWLLNETRNNIAWLLAYAALLFAALRRTLSRQQPIEPGGHS